MSIQKSIRIRKLEKYVCLGYSNQQIAAELGLKSARTIRRYLQHRHQAIEESLRDQAALTRQQHLTEAERDTAILNAIIQDPETSAAVRVAAVATKNQVRRTVSRILGLEAADKHWHLHAAQSNVKPLPPVQSGPVNIIFERYGPSDPGYDPNFVPGHRIGKPIDVEAERTEDR